MNKKLVGLVVNEMSGNDYKLFMFEELRNSNINFQVYDISPLVFKKSYNTKYSDFVISQKKELINLIQKEENFIIYFDKDIKYKSIFDVLEVYSQKNYFKIANGKILTGANNKKSIYSKIKKVFNKNKLKNFFYIKLTKKINFNTFEAGISSNGIEIPSFEYDNYLKLKQKKGNFTKKYHVFLDNNMAFHRDLDLLGINVINNYELYYKKLRLFFDHIEKNTNKEVIIALHPRTDHAKYDFGDRKTVIGDTAELMWDADLAFVHDSTSLHYAIIYNKDIILLTNNEIDSSEIVDNLKKFEYILGLKRLNIDDFDDFENIYKYTNKEGYPEYMLNNIISDNVKKNRLGSDIVIESLSELLKENQ